MKCKKCGRGGDYPNNVCDACFRGLIDRVKESCQRRENLKKLRYYRRGYRKHQ